MSTSMTRDREDEGSGEPASKRVKLDASTSEDVSSVLPPSHTLLGIGEPGPKLREVDVGISEYIGAGIAKINGIIKQRFTDFLVYEVDQDSNVIHIKSLAKPQSTPGADGDGVKNEVLGTDSAVGQPTQADAANESVVPDAGQPSEVKSETPTQEKAAEPEEPWPDRFNTVLEPFFDPEPLSKLKEIFLQGPNPPRLSDSGWASRPPKNDASAEGAAGEPMVVDAVPEPPKDEEIEIKEGKGKPERGGRGRGRGRGRGGRGGGRGGGVKDERKVLTKPIDSKETRTDLHKAVKELFGGKLDTETDSSAPAEDGPRIVVRWGRGGRGGNQGGRGGGRSAPRGTYPPYIHFTLQKTNRDTQDALAHLSRTLHVNIRDLSVAGTKDKRGVTVQRISLKRGGKSVEDVWMMANGQTGGANRRKTEEQALTQRGERGVRAADFNYRKSAMELGMLKGNAFVITLRNVQVESMDTLHEAMNVIKHKGFINYYGMQRFGTADIPTHTIGLALLKSDWNKAVELILQQRQGEHPDVVAARDAWLVDRDLDKALELMPRRVVAERCILESYKKQGGETRNAMGALSTIPKNLRLMYIHAYQSYVWNAIVSERIRTSGADRPIPGDLVFDKSVEEPKPAVDAEDDEQDEPMSFRDRKRARNAQWTPPQVKTLTEENVDQYTVFDVIVPLPGKDIAYPGGELGEKYKKFLILDGLDPDNFDRKQKDYILKGSYRTLLHLPKELSYQVLRYTDPDVPLAQADEDKLLGFEPPAIVEDGKFMALQIQLTLGTAAYATMALREVTKTETSSHFQSKLTEESADQKYRGMDIKKDVEDDAIVVGIDIEDVEGSD